MATYDYNSTLEKLDVTPGQAFTNEEWSARSRFTPTATTISEHFMIVQKGPAEFVPEYRSTHMGWQFFYQNEITTIRFATYAEAEAFTVGMMHFLEWMSGVALSTAPEEEVHALISKLRRSEAARRHNFDVLFDLRRISWEAPMHWREEYRQLSIATLRTTAQDRGLDVVGKKSHLIDVLVADREQETARQIADTEAMIARNNSNIAKLQGVLKTG